MHAEAHIRDDNAHHHRLPATLISPDSPSRQPARLPAVIRRATARLFSACPLCSILLLMLPDVAIALRAQVPRVAAFRGAIACFA